MIAVAALAIFGGATIPSAYSAPTSGAKAADRVRAADEPASPFAGKIISDIDIQGLKRIEKDAVLGKVGSRAGQKISRQQVRTDIQALFAMGYFDDIEVAAVPVDGQRALLRYTLRERPVISKVVFDGNERLSDTDLKDVVKVKEWSILDVNKVREDVGLIQKHYEEKGFYLAKVSFALKQVSAEEVELTYHINDYEKVQIKKITFLNNRKFTDEQLKSAFQETKEGSFFSFLSSGGNFKDTSFKQDLQRLTYWYLDHGYVKFRYENPVVTVSEDKRWLYISVYVDEGEQYKMGGVDFGGDMLFPKEELKEELTLVEDEIFSISKRNTDIQRLTEKYQDLGYAFTNVIPRMNFHDDTRVVDMTYAFEKGNLVYFGEINIVGNTKTHDKVIRRELKIKEGELFNGTRLRQSRENVERLGFFAPGEVLFNTITPKGKNDVVNVEIAVKERSTGTITLGAGYGSAQGFFFTTSVSEINLLGRGQNLTLSAQYAAQSVSKSFNLGFTDPYAFDTRWSLGGDVYSVVFPIPAKYTTRKLGFDARAGYPLAEYTNGYVTYKQEGLQISELASGNLPPVTYQGDVGSLSSFVFSIIRDRRNNRFETTDGNYQSASAEWAGFWGDKHFIKWNLNNRYYKRILGDLVFRNSVEVGQISGVGGRGIPPSERFYLGGPNNMKGYEYLNLGPKIPLLGSSDPTVPIGGTFQAFSLFELEYPLIREAGLKFVLFFDAGNTWDHLPSGDEVLSVRTDAGFGIRWFSPIGPLRFEWGFPTNPKPNESPMVFQFFIGPPF